MLRIRQEYLPGGYFLKKKNFSLIFSLLCRFDRTGPSHQSLRPESRLSDSSEECRADVSGYIKLKLKNELFIRSRF